MRNDEGKKNIKETGQEIVNIYFLWNMWTIITMIGHLLSLSLEKDMRLKQVVISVNVFMVFWTEMTGAAKKDSLFIWKDIS